MKPDNILFAVKGNLDSLKICDFGLANKVGVGLFDQNDEQVGTLIYQAPEQIRDDSYGKFVDIWATGIVMYMLITKGGHPMIGDNILNGISITVEEYKDKILNLGKDYKITDGLNGFDQHARRYSLLENMCDIRPNMRYNTQRALMHPWITRNENGRIPMNLYQELQLDME